MRRKTQSAKPYNSRYTHWHRLAAVAIMLSMLSFLFTIPAMARNTYTITDGEKVIVHSTFQSNPRAVLKEIGLKLSSSDTYTTQGNGNEFQIIINRVRWQKIRVICDGKIQSVKTRGETVESVLKRLQIAVEKDDLVSCPLDTKTYTGLTVRITRVTYGSNEYDTALPAEDAVYYNTVMSPSEETVLQEGSNGLAHCKEKITYHDGREVSHALISQTVVKPAVDRVVIRGAKTASMPASSGKNTVTTSGGETLSYSKVISGMGTAYTCVGYTGHTASGTVAEIGKVAVDPNVIPLGTKLYIVSQDGRYVYGYCIAEDTGGLVKGTRVDLYMDTWDDCINFGYRPITIYIVA